MGRWNLDHLDQEKNRMDEQANSSLARQTFVVILAAGKGTRMGRNDMAKVCFEIDGVPAISRLIGTFSKNRFEKFMVVVGSMADQVVNTVGRDYPQAIFVCQSPQLGTGHAGKVAADALQNVGHAGPVLLCLGDKYIEPAAVTTLPPPAVGATASDSSTAPGAAASTSTARTPASGRMKMSGFTCSIVLRAVSRSFMPP
jgi:CTP:molybdopterin cytidylyltransferase MocA